MSRAGIRVAGHPRWGSDTALRIGLPVALLAIAAVGWWWSAHVADDMSGGAMDEMAMADTMGLGAFVVAWVAMMAAMMFPAVLPVVKLYALAAAKGRAAPVGFFVGGYLAVWTVLSLPAYLAWRALEMPLADGDAWAGRVAGITLIVAGLWQVSPLKSICLQHCRSPLSFFMRIGDSVRRPVGAFRMGAVHGAYCVGCCWALFAVLVAAASMSLVWLVVFTGLIVIEKNAPYGERFAQATAPVLAGLGVALLITPSWITTIA